MGVSKIYNYVTLKHVTAPTVDQLKNAKAIIVHYRVSDNTAKSTLALIPNEKTTGLTATWNGVSFFFSIINILWSKTDGTITITTSYSERPDTTISLIGYDLFM
jgi:hypothetical protein